MTLDNTPPPLKQNIGSGAFSDIMLMVKIDNNKIDDYLGQVRLSKG